MAHPERGNYRKRRALLFIDLKKRTTPLTDQNCSKSCLAYAKVTRIDELSDLYKSYIKRASTKSEMNGLKRAEGSLKEVYWPLHYLPYIWTMP